MSLFQANSRRPPRGCLDVARGSHLGQRTASRVKGRTHDRIRTKVNISQTYLNPTGRPHMVLCLRRGARSAAGWHGSEICPPRGNARTAERTRQSLGCIWWQPDGGLSTADFAASIGAIIIWPAARECCQCYRTRSPNLREFARGRNHAKHIWRSGTWVDVRALKNSGGYDGTRNCADNGRLWLAGR
jgi:hypothetical protein